MLIVADNQAPFRIDIDFKDLQKLQDSLDEVSGKAVKQAHVRSLDRALNTGRSQAAKFYQSSYSKVKQADVKDKINTYVNRKTERVEDISGVLEIVRRGFRLEKVGARATKTGVRYQGPDGFTEIKGAFYAKVYKSNVGPNWWIRTGLERLPLKFLWAPSPYTVFKFDKNQETISIFMKDRYLEETDANLKFYLTKAFIKLSK